jgi:hypothetical protein
MKNNFEFALILLRLFIVYLISVVIYPDTLHTRALNTREFTEFTCHVSRVKSKIKTYILNLILYY